MRCRWLAGAVGVAIAITGVVSAAAIASGFPGYLDTFVELPHALSSALLVLVLGAIAARGIREAVWTAAAITLLELVGLLMVLAVAGGSLAELPARLPEMVPTDTAGVSGLMVGGFMAFYAYVGFEDIQNNAEEVIDERRQQLESRWHSAKESALDETAAFIERMADRVDRFRDRLGEDGEEKSE